MQGLVLETAHVNLQYRQVPGDLSKTSYYTEGVRLFDRAYIKGKYWIFNNQSCV